MSEFKKEQTKKQNEKDEAGGLCKFCSAVLKLPKPKIVDLVEAFDDKSIYNETIHEVLSSWNVKTSLTTIRGHRNGKSDYAKHLTVIKQAASK